MSIVYFVLTIVMTHILLGEAQSDNNGQVGTSEQPKLDTTNQPNFNYSYGITDISNTTLRNLLNSTTTVSVTPPHSPSYGWTTGQTGLSISQQSTIAVSDNTVGQHGHTGQTDHSGHFGETSQTGQPGQFGQPGQTGQSGEAGRTSQTEPSTVHDHDNHSMHHTHGHGHSASSPIIVNKSSWLTLFVTPLLMNLMLINKY